MFGCGAVAQLVLSGGSHGMFLTVNFAFGFAATLGILVCGQVSGTQSILLEITLSKDFFMTYLVLLWVHGNEYFPSITFLRQIQFAEPHFNLLCTIY